MATKPLEVNFNCLYMCDKRFIPSILQPPVQTGPFQPELPRSAA